jgi:hypothetical protein
VDVSTCYIRALHGHWNLRLGRLCPLSNIVWRNHRLRPLSNVVRRNHRLREHEVPLLVGSLVRASAEPRMLPHVDRVPTHCEPDWTLKIPCDIEPAAQDMPVQMVLQGWPLVAQHLSLPVAEKAFLRSWAR